MKWKWSLQDCEISFRLEGLKLVAEPIDPNSIELVNEVLLVRKLQVLEQILLKHLADQKLDTHRTWGSRFLFNVLRSSRVTINNFSVEFSDPQGIIGHAPKELHFGCSSINIFNLESTTNEPVKKLMTLNGIGLKFADSDLISPFNATVNFSLTPQTENLTLDASSVFQIEGECVTVRNLTTEIIAYFHNFILYITQLEDWIIFHQRVKLSASRWHRAISWTLERIRFNKKWLPIDVDRKSRLEVRKKLYKEFKREKIAKKWVKKFELACPLELLKSLRIEMETEHRGVSTSYFDMYTWANSLLENRNFAQDEFIKGIRNLKEDEGDSRLGLLKASLKLETITVFLEHDESISKVDFGIHMVLSEQNEGTIYSFSLDSLNVHYVNQDVLVIHNKDSLSHQYVDDEGDTFFSDDEDNDQQIRFYDAEEEESDLKLVLPKHSLLRVLVSVTLGGMVSLKLVADPIEIRWCDAFVSSMIDMYQNFLQLKTNVAMTTTSPIQQIQCRIGAPRIAFFEGENVSKYLAVADLGYLSFTFKGSLLEISYGGLSVWLVDTEGSHALSFGSQTLRVAQVVGHLDVKGTINISRASNGTCRYEISVMVLAPEKETTRQVLLSSKCASMLASIQKSLQVLNITKPKNKMSEYTYDLNVSIKEFSAGFQHPLGTTILNISFSNCILEVLSSGPNDTVAKLLANNLVIQDVETRDSLVLCSCIGAEYDWKHLKVKIPESLRLSWLPSTIARVKHAIDLESIVVMEPRGHSNVNLSFEAHELHIILKNETDNLAELHLMDCLLEQSWSGHLSNSTTLSIQSILLEDHRFEIMAYHQGPALNSVSEQQCCIHVHIDCDGHFTHVEVAIGSIKAVVWQPFFSELHDYFSTGILGILTHRIGEYSSTMVLPQKNSNISVSELVLIIPCATYMEYPHVNIVLGIKLSDENDEGLRLAMEEPCISVVSDAVSSVVVSQLVHPLSFTTGPDNCLSIEVEDVDISLNHMQAACMMQCFVTNLLNNKHILETLIYDSENLHSLPFWRRRQRNTGKRVCAQVKAVRVEFVGGPNCELELFTMNTSSSFSPTAQAFGYHNEFNFSGLLVSDNLKSVLVGSRANINLPGEPCVGSVLVGHDPDQVSWNVVVSLDFLQCVWNPDILQSCTTFASQVQSQIEEWKCDESAQFLPQNKNISVEVELLDNCWWLMEHEKGLQYMVSVFGNLSTTQINGNNHYQEGNIQVKQSVSIVDLPPAATQSHSDTINTLAMNHVSSRALNENQIIPSFSLDVKWEMPFNQPFLTKLLNVTQSDNMRIDLSIQNIDILNRLLFPVPATLSEASRRSFIHIFESEPLGLKLGPSSQFPNLLEVRGFTRTCEEAAVHAITVGDIVSSVNGQSLLNCTTQEDSKAVLRESEWPRAIEFHRESDSSPVIDALQYVPLSQLSWVCSNCDIVQPLSKRTVNTILQCTSCRATHVDPEWNASSSPAATILEAGVVEEDVIYENQRLFTLFGWTPSMLPSDPHAWCTIDSSKKVDDLSKTSLQEFEVPDGTSTLKWAWIDSWTVDPHTGDQAGWTYARQFQSMTREGMSVQKSFHSVRRRCWIRKRVLKSFQDATEIVESKEVEVYIEDKNVETTESSCNQEQLAIVFDNAGYTIELNALSRYPVFSLRLGEHMWARCLVLESREDEISFRTAMGATLSLWGFNNHAFEFEPLIEPVLTTAEIQRAEGVYSLTVLSSTVWRINLPLHQVYQFLNFLKSKESQDPFAVVHNLSGCSISVIDSSSKQDVDPMESVMVGTYSQRGVPEHISLRLYGGWMPLNELHFRRLGTVVYAIETSEHHDVKSKSYGRLVVETKKEGTKSVMQVHSLYHLENRFGSSIFLKLADSQRTVLLDPLTCGDSTYLPMLPALETMHLTIRTPVPGTISLSELTQKAASEVSKNLALAVTTDVFVEQQMLKLGPTSFGIFYSLAHVIDNCYSSTRASVTVNHRSIVGKKYSTCQIRSFLASPVVIVNETGEFSKFRIRRRLKPKSLQEFECLDTLYIDTVDDWREFEWCISIPHVSNMWSAWNQFDAREFQQMEMKNSYNQSLKIAYSSRPIVPNVTISVKLVLHPVFRATLLTSSAIEIGVETGTQIRDIPGQLPISTVKVHINERWHPIRGWTAPFLNSVPAHTSWAYSSSNVSDISELPVAKGWQWAEPEWKRTHDKPWLYSSDFNSDLWVDNKQVSSCVRRQVWCRASVRMNQDRTYAILGRPSGFAMRIRNDEWSSIVHLGNDGIHAVDVSDQGMLIPMLVEVIGDEISIRNQFSFQNKSNSKLFVYTTVKSYRCEDDDLELYDPDSRTTRAISVNAGDSNSNLKWIGGARYIRMGQMIGNMWFWSGPIDPSIVDTFDVFLRRPKDRKILRVFISVLESKVVQIAVADGSDPTLYRIDNRTLHALKCAQQAVVGVIPVLVKDRRTCSFAWDEMSKLVHPKLRIVASQDDGKETIGVDIDLFGDFTTRTQDICFQDDNKLIAYVYSEGVTKVVCISHAWAVVCPPKHVKETFRFVCSVDIVDGMHLSFLDTVELIHARIRRIHVACSKSDILQKVGFEIHSMRITDGNFLNANRVLLDSKPAINFFTFRSCKFEHFFNGIHRMKYLGLQFGDFKMRVDARQFKMFRYLRSVGSEIILACRLETSSSASLRLLIDSLHVQSFMVDLSLFPSSENLRGFEGIDLFKFQDTCNHSISSGVLDIITGAVSRVTDINKELPYWAIALDFLLRSELRDCPVGISSSIMTHVPWNLASAFVIQNIEKCIISQLAPTLLVSSDLSSLNPFQLFRSRTGLTSTANLMLTGLSRGLSAATLSGDFIERRKTISRSSSSWIESVGNGFTEGIGGLVSEPYRGARSGGVSGLLSGVGRGIAGAAVKPIIGVLDATVGSMSPTEVSTSNSQKPLYGSSSMLKIYSETDAVAAFFLHTTHHAAFLREYFYGSFHAADGLEYVVSNNRILCTSNQINILLDSIVSFSVTKIDNDSWGIQVHCHDSNYYIPCGLSKQRTEHPFYLIHAASKTIPSYIVNFY